MDTGHASDLCTCRLNCHQSQKVKLYSLLSLKSYLRNPRQTLPSLLRGSQCQTPSLRVERPPAILAQSAPPGRLKRPASGSAAIGCAHSWTGRAFGYIGALRCSSSSTWTLYGISSLGQRHSGTTKSHSRNPFRLDARASFCDVWKHLRKRSSGILGFGFEF